MLTIRKSNNLSLSKRGLSSESSNGKSSIGTDSKTRRVKAEKGITQDSFISESYGLPTPTMGPNVNVSSSPITLDLDPMLLGITPQIEQTLVLGIYRDMYYHDPIAGSAADLMSFLPFSDYSIGGVEARNPKQSSQITGVFNEALERLNIRTLMPELSIDYLVMGAHVSSLLYNKEKKVFTDILPHALEHLTIEPIPFYSLDPIITVKFSDQVKTLLAKDTDRIKNIKERMGKATIDKIMADSLELDPLSTLYVPRRSFSTTDLGTSYFKRILPYYLIEKNLFRGTLVESARRQRGILHVTAGDGEQWEPTVHDLEFLTDLFMNADSDPLGAIIATRMGVSVEELRQGGEFWKVSDYQDSVLSHKLRALGISEGFLSGEANYNTADTGLTVFIDMIRSYRDMITRKTLYNKIFPLISMTNGYILNSKGEVVVRSGIAEHINTEDALYVMNDGSKLLIPTVTWAKNLKPEGDEVFMNTLNGLAEKGVPIPLRVLAAAGGLNLDDLLKQQDDDLELRKKLAEYQKLIAKINPPAEGEGGGEGEGEAEASDKAFTALASEDPTGAVRSAVLARGGRKSILDRDFGEIGEVTSRTKTGRRKFVHNQKLANEKVNSIILKAVREANKEGKYKPHTVKVKRKNR